MEKIIQLLNGSITELNKLENEIKNLSDEELGRLAASYPFNDYFHEVVLKLQKWKIEIENQKVVQ